MGLLDDAQAAMSGCDCYRRVEFNDCRNDTCVDDIMPKIVAVLEAAGRIQEPTIVEEVAVGYALVYAGCDREVEQGHTPDCEHQALREALDA